MATPQHESLDTVVIVARHGERLDYVFRDRSLQDDGSSGNWVSTADRPWDPPLTDHGMEQGTKLGNQLIAEVSTRDLPPICAIYSSPFLRCRQTAACVRRAVMNAGVVVVATDDEAAVAMIPPVRVELGLAESLNENWYRSWALPGADGTWGYRIPGGSDQVVEPVALHPASKQPVQVLLEWKDDSIQDPDLDYEYTSVTEIHEPYCFHPRNLESRQDQRHRMASTVHHVKQPGQTVVLVSHGGPATHLYEHMTGNRWDVHGPSTYCCYSIYRQPTNADGSDTWEAVAVNESNYLDEKLVAERHVSSDHP